MTLILSGDITLRRTWQPMDPDAAAYITAVETADGQALEEKVKIAIDNFVLGCKADGVWDAIKASCILAGARTLNGALVPLTGAAPTNFNFVAGDYDRKTGLPGNGSTKYLDSNRTANADPLNNYHCAVFPTQIATLGGSPRLIECQLYTDSGATGLAENTLAGYVAYSRRSVTSTNSPRVTSSLVGVSRANSSEYQFRRNGSQISVSTSSLPLSNGSVTWKLYTNANNSLEQSNARIAFYSIGESLDLALLDARVTDLINKFAEVIP